MFCIGKYRNSSNHCISKFVKPSNDDIEVQSVNSDSVSYYYDEDLSSICSDSSSDVGLEAEETVIADDEYDIIPTGMVVTNDISEWISETSDSPLNTADTIKLYSQQKVDETIADMDMNSHANSNIGASELLLAQIAQIAQIKEKIMLV